MNEPNMQKLGSSNSRCFFATNEMETMASPFSDVTFSCRGSVVEKLLSEMVSGASVDSAERRPPRCVRYLCSYARIAKATCERNEAGVYGGVVDCSVSNVV